MTIDGYQNQVHIKPKVAIVATNLVIYTNRRAYRIDYSASNRIPSRLSAEAIYAVRFSYPDSGKSSAANGETGDTKINRELAGADKTRSRNVDYWYCGHKSIMPLAASDDGIHTRLTFNARTELPAIFVRNDDGSESLLNFSVEEGDVVIHRVARKFILRRGRLTGCIVNQGFAGTGERLESGTLSPDVQRDRKDPRP